MYTFELLQLKKFPLVKDWYLKIDSIQDLFEYTSLTDPVRAEKALLQYMKVTEGKAHYTYDTLAFPSAIMSERHQITFVEGLIKLLDSTLQNKIKHISNGITIYINCNGGYTIEFADNPTHIVLEIIQSDKLIFPHKKLEDVKYFKWPNGKHWYAKIGGIDVVDSLGNQKWNTKVEAEEVAKKFIREKTI